MAQRRGEKITARDAAALNLAAATLDAQAAQITKANQVYGDVILRQVIAEADAKAMRDSIAAILEVHT